MSAAEKLRRLKPTQIHWIATLAGQHVDERAQELYDVPMAEIIAVVEGAERCRDEKDLHNWYVEESGQPHTEDCLGCALEKTLDALNAKLDPPKELASGGAVAKSAQIP